MAKKLYKSSKDKQISGVLAGVGEYFDIDPTLVRVGYLVLTLLTGIFPGVIAYFVMAIIIPSKKEVARNGKKRR